MTIPTPEELWGSCEIESWVDWPKRDKGMFVTWLNGISAIIIFADQYVIDRVNKDIRDIIAKANEGAISSKDAVRSVSPGVIISPEEWKIIQANARKHGKMIEEFYGETSKPNN
jgi:hypothetical protein